MRPSASVRYRPGASVMNRGVPPTALKARTGEFTPPGIPRAARANSASLRAGRRPESESHGTSQASTRYSSSRSASGSGCPAGGRSQRAARPVAVPGRRGEHVAVPAVPAQARPRRRSPARSPGRRTTIRPRRRARPWSPRRTASGPGPARRPGRRDLRRAPSAPARDDPGRRGHVKNVKNPAGDEDHVRLRPGFPPALDHFSCLRSPASARRRDRVRARRRAADPVARAGAPGSIPARGPRWGWAPGTPASPWTRTAPPRRRARRRSAARPRPLPSAPHHVDHRPLTPVVSWLSLAGVGCWRRRLPRG